MGSRNVVHFFKKEERFHTKEEICMKQFKTLTLSAVCMLSILGMVSCGNSSSNSAGSANSTSGLQMSTTYLDETDIGNKTTIDADKKASYTEANPLKLGLVTDSGTLNDHSFNESAWNGVNAFATENGGGTVNSTTNCVETGLVQTKYVQPASDAYTTAGRVAAIKSVVEWGAKIVILPGYLFESAIKICLADSTYNNVNFLALDCNKEDPDNGYASYEYTDRVTSVIYREEEAGFFAGYGAVMEGYRKLGFIGGMAVPAVIRYGSGYVQGIDYAAQQLGLADSACSVNYYYAGAFAATDAATSYANSWYSRGTEVIFPCGGSVYNSVTTASKANNNKPWIGVDVNQHADTTLGTETQASCITSAMKNLTNSTKVMLASWANNNCEYTDVYASKVITVGAETNNCCLPTPEETGDAGCWGFKTFTLAQYADIKAKVVAGTVKVNSFADKDALAANNYGGSAKVKVNVISD